MVGEQDEDDSVAMCHVPHRLDTVWDTKETVHE